MDVLGLALLALLFGLVALFAIRAWKGHGRLSGPDHLALITSFAVASTAFVVAPRLIDWVRVPTVLWLLAVALLAGGVAGAALRWPELAWCTGTHPIRRAIGVGAALVSCTLIIGVAAT